MFWWLAMVYTVLGLIAAYNFQLHSLAIHWNDLMGFTNEQLEDTSLERFHMPKFFSRILIPGLSCFPAPCLPCTQHFMQFIKQVL